MSEFSNKTVLVVDQGAFVYVAERLAQSFDRVLYAADNWRTAFPNSRLRQVGLGLDNVQRVANMWDHVDEADLIVFPDVYFSAESEYLRRAGKRVWGAGRADALELYRGDLKETLKRLGLQTGRYELVQGILNLREYLATHSDVYVKLNVYRGDGETFHAPDYPLIKPLIDDMEAKLGPRAGDIEFIVEEPIHDAAEPGYDGTCIDGHFPNVAAWGYEAKDEGYLGQICEYSDLPEPLREINAKLSPLLASLGMRGFFHTEVRVRSQRDFTLIDPCCRAGSPPTEAEMEAYKNWDEHIWHGADGKLADLEPAGRYIAEIILRSPWVRERDLPVSFPENIRRWVKLHGHMRQDGQDWALSLGCEEFGSAVAVGDSVEEVVRLAKERASQVEALDVEYADGALSRAMDAIDEGKKHGVEW